MLILTRRTGEAIIIGDNVRLEVYRVGAGQVRIAITAPREIPVHRQEVWERIQRGKPPGI